MSDADPFSTIATAVPDTRPPASDALEEANINSWGELPNSREAERSLIECALANQHILPSLIQKVRTNDFYNEGYRAVFAAVMALSAAGRPIDPVTLIDQLQGQGELKLAGGADAIRQACAFAQSSESWDAHADIVRDKARLRQLHALGARLVNGALSPAAGTDALLDELQRAAIRLNAESASAQQTVDAKALALDAISRMSERFDSRDKLGGISTGLERLDFLLGGCRPKRLVVIAGPPKGGKSSLMRQILLHAALVAQQAVGLFTIEMSKEEVIDAMIATAAQVDSMRIDRAVLLTERNIADVQAAAVKLGGSKLYIRDESALTPMQFQAGARQMVAEFGVKIIALDYLQIMRSANGGGRQGNREQEVSDFASTAKEVAKELDICVIALSQLNKDGTTRESSAIEMHADTVIKIRHADPDAPDGGDVDLDIPYNRGAPKGKVPCIWRGSYTKFEPRH